ncbi:MAG: hypothetical protein PWQ66_1071 [Petrotoga sp.]|nr:hypothetical protein [Petrotoga sp.]
MKTNKIDAEISLLRGRNFYSYITLLAILTDVILYLSSKDLVKFGMRDNFAKIYI